MEKLYTKSKALHVIVFTLIMLAFSVNYSYAAFRFVISGDSELKSGDPVTKITETSNRIKALATQPAIILIPGDVGYTTLKANMNSVLFGKVFPIRGNHDGSTPGWTSAQISARVTSVGAKNYSTMSGEAGLTYSFDYGLSHFVSIDSHLLSTLSLTAAQIAWLDADLTKAKARGQNHAFIQTHAPLIGCGGGNTTSVPANIIPIINKHTIISAWFGGHTHVFAWTHVNSARVPGLTHQIESFNTGPFASGSNSLAGVYDAGIGRTHGYATVDISALTFTIKWYDVTSTTPKWSKAFSK